MTATRTAMPSLLTPRLCLRRPRMADARALTGLANDWEVAKQTASLPHPYHLTDAKAWIATASDEIRFVVERRGGAPIGALRLREREDRFGIGYWFGRRHWDQGFATEAVAAAVRHAFQELGATKVAAGVFIENPASFRVLEKVGFTAIGVVERTLEHRGGQRRIRRFELTQGDLAETAPMP